MPYDENSLFQTEACTRWWKNFSSITEKFINFFCLVLEFLVNLLFGTIIASLYHWFSCHCEVISFNLVELCKTQFVACE